MKSSISSMVRSIAGRKSVPTDGLMKKVGGMGGVANIGLTAWGGVTAYNDARMEGKGVARSATESAFITAAYNMMGWKTAGLVIGGQVLYEGAKMGIQTGVENSRNYSKMGTASPFAQQTFMDSEQSYTMRQAGMTMIQQNAMNTKKAVMGNEAMHMHR